MEVAGKCFVNYAPDQARVSMRYWPTRPVSNLTRKGPSVSRMALGFKELPSRGKLGLRTVYKGTVVLRWLLAFRFSRGLLWASDSPWTRPHCRGLHLDHEIEGIF
jgi:hypothetical protein